MSTMECPFRKKMILFGSYCLKEECSCKEVYLTDKCVLSNKEFSKLKELMEKFIDREN